MGTLGNVNPYWGMGALRSRAAGSVLGLRLAYLMADRRQRHEVVCDGGPVLGRQFARARIDYGPHAVLHVVAVGLLPGLEQIGDVLLAPRPDAGRLVRRYVGHRAALGALPRAGERVVQVELAEQIARRVTLRTVSERPDEIGAAVPCGRARRLRREGSALEEESVPPQHEDAEAEGKP